MRLMGEGVGRSGKGWAFEDIVHRLGQLEVSLLGCCLALPTLTLARPLPLSSLSSPGAGAGSDGSP